MAPSLLPAQASFPKGWQYPAGMKPAFAEHAMVASSSKAAAAAGTEILKAGGNAVDAAVAVGFALTVVYPEAGNIGGGGYMIIRMADGRTAALDYRETAPAAASRNMYVDSAGTLTSYSINGRSAAGVPAAVAGSISIPQTGSCTVVVIMYLLLLLQIITLIDHTSMSHITHYLQAFLPI